MRFGLKNDIVDKINRAISSVPVIEEAIVYGSRAKGNSKPGSDIDIALKGNKITMDDLNRLNRILDDLLLPYTFDLTILRRIDNQELLDHIERVGIVLYTRMGD